MKKYQVRLAQQENQKREGKQISPTRVNIVMQLLRSILGQEFNDGHIDRDPSKSVRRMTGEKVVIDPLSSEELERVLDHLDPHYRPLFEVLAFSGARPNEMLALRWSDIDSRREIISIRRGRVRGKEGLPKTKSSQRDIPINPRVMQALKAIEARGVKSIDGYVFTNKHGEPIDKHLDRIWTRALAKAGVRHRRSYQLRHTFATQCIINGLPLPYIAKLGGWSTIDVLIRNYAGWIDEYTREQDARLKEMFKAKPASSPDQKGGIVNLLRTEKAMLACVSEF